MTILDLLTDPVLIPDLQDKEPKMLTKRLHKAETARGHISKNKEKCHAK